MAEVIIVCVSDDLPQAEGLAEMFELGGFDVRDDVFNDVALMRAAAGVLVLTPAALACERFRDAGQRVVEAGKGVLACLEPTRHCFDAPAFELFGWYGRPKDPVLDALFFAVDRMRADRLHARAYAPQIARVEAPALQAHF